MKTENQTASAFLFDQISNYWTEIAQANHTEKQLCFVKNNIPPQGYVLDLCCGSGRHTLALAQTGYAMVGIDFSFRLLRIAKQKAAQTGIHVTLVRADMRFLPFTPETFASVVSLDASFGYLPSEKQDLQSLNEASRVLEHEGVLLLDVFNRERLMKRYRKRFRVDLSLFYRLLPKLPRLAVLLRWKEYPSFYLRQTHKVTRDGGKLLEMWVILDKKTKNIHLASHVSRLYESPQLRLMLEKAGIQVCRVLGNYDMQEYQKDSKRLIFVAQK
jgi:ubiquinone/menaquinone biosynthesis C-methylase UbiE